jgi:hypothetical protein
VRTLRYVHEPNSQIQHLILNVTALHTVEHSPRSIVRILLKRDVLEKLTWEGSSRKREYLKENLQCSKENRPSESRLSLSLSGATRIGPRIATSEKYRANERRSKYYLPISFITRTCTYCLLQASNQPRRHLRHADSCWSLLAVSVRGKQVIPCSKIRSSS